MDRGKWCRNQGEKGDSVNIIKTKLFDVNGPENVAVVIDKWLATLSKDGQRRIRVISTTPIVSKDEAYLLVMVGIKTNETETETESE